MSNPWKIAVLPLALAALAATWLALVGSGRGLRPAVLDRTPPEFRHGGAVAIKDGGQADVDADAFQILHERSLFSPERRSELDLATDDEDKGVADLELVGVGMVGDQAVAAVLELDKTGKSRRASGNVYKIGETVGDSGYKIENINLTEVLLTKGGAQRVLPLKHDDANSGARRGNAGAAGKSQSQSATARNADSAVAAGSRRSGSGRTTTAGGSRTDKNEANAAAASSSYAFAKVNSGSVDNDADGGTAAPKGFAVASGLSSRRTAPDNRGARRTSTAGNEPKIISAKDVRKKLVQPDNENETE